MAGRHRDELEAVTDDQSRFDRLVELNVLEQLRNIRLSSVYRKAGQQHLAPLLHGWVYDFKTGLVKVIYQEQQQEILSC